MCMQERFACLDRFQVIQENEIWIFRFCEDTKQNIKFEYFVMLTNDCQAVIFGSHRCVKKTIFWYTGDVKPDFRGITQNFRTKTINHTIRDRKTNIFRVIIEINYNKIKSF